MPESEAVRMGRNVQIGDLADVIMETLEDYADLAAEDVKQAVREAGLASSPKRLQSQPFRSAENTGSLIFRSATVSTPASIR